MRRFPYAMACGMAIALSLGALLVLAGLLGRHSAISFVVAYGSSLLVILSSYHAVRKRLQKELGAMPEQPMWQNPKPSPPESTSQEAFLPESTSLEALSLESTPRETISPESSAQTSKPSSNPSFLSRFILGVQISFGLYRLLSYVVLIAGVVVLMRYGAFGVVGYVAGVLLCAISVALLARKRINAPQVGSRL